MNYKISLDYLIKIFILLIFTLFLIGLSFQQIFTWPFAEMYAGMERLYLDKDLYPENNRINTYPISTYFPGLSFFLLFIKKIFFFVETNYISNLLLSSLFIIILTLQQYSIAKKDNLDINQFNFLVLTCFLYMTLFRHHAEYATSFKPDTIALTLSLFAIAINSRYKNYFIKIIAGLIFAFSVLFKQQFLFFFISYLLFISLADFHKSRIFIISSLVSILLLFYYLLNIDNFYEYTILSFKDDKFITIYEWIKLHNGFLIWLLFLFPFLFFNASFHEKSKTAFELLKNKLVRFDPLFFALLILGSVSLASAFKYGGNSGNTGFALLCVYPYLFNFFYIKLRRVVLVFLVIFITFVSYNSFQNGFSEYRKYLNLNNAVIGFRDNVILFEKKLYPVSTSINKKFFFDTNFNPSDLTLKKSAYIRNKDDKIYLVISTKLFKDWKENYNYFVKQEFSIEYENKVGIILFAKNG